MTLDEMRTLRAELESALTFAASQAVTEFENRTGLKVDAVYVDLVTNQIIGSAIRSVVTGAHLQVRL